MSETSILTKGGFLIRTFLMFIVGNSKIYLYNKACSEKVHEKNKKKWRCITHSHFFMKTIKFN